MSHGPGKLQRQILEFMRQHALKCQRTPQREHWLVEPLIVNLISRRRVMASRQHADARKRIRRACNRLAATGHLHRFGKSWALPPETNAEAKSRRKRFRISARDEREQAERLARMRPLFDPTLVKATPLDRATRIKLTKMLGLLGSEHDGEVLNAARQVERLRTEIGATWADLIA
jgi:hypothetical protein